MDRRLFEKMYSYAQKNRRFGLAAVLLTKASSKIFFLIYISVLFFFRYKPDKLIPVIVIPFITLCASLAIRDLLKRPRPYEALVLGKKTYSLPSNHSASAAVIACTCLYCHSGLGAAALSLAFLTGLSRVFSGLHYPADVAAGWMLGSLSACMYLFL